jgi:hypothetical protein
MWKLRSPVSFKVTLPSPRHGMFEPAGEARASLPKNTYFPRPRTSL